MSTNYLNENYLDPGCLKSEAFRAMSCSTDSRSSKSGSSKSGSSKSGSSKSSVKTVETERAEITCNEVCGECISYRLNKSTNETTKCVIYCTDCTSDCCKVTFKVIKFLLLILIQLVSLVGPVFIEIGYLTHNEYYPDWFPFLTIFDGKIAFSKSFGKQAMLIGGISVVSIYTSLATFPILVHVWKKCTRNSDYRRYIEREEYPEFDEACDIINNDWEDCMPSKKAYFIFFAHNILCQFLGQIFVSLIFWRRYISESKIGLFEVPHYGAFCYLVGFASIHFTVIVIYGIIWLCKHTFIFCCEKPYQNARDRVRHNQRNVEV